MNQYEKCVKDLLAAAGIAVNGQQRYEVEIKDQRFYERIVTQGHMGLGESYMDGWWECDALDEFVHRVLSHHLEHRVRRDKHFLWIALTSKLFNRQNLSRAFQVGERHYNMGNDLFSAMLDRRMNYSCAIWEEGATLDEAQENKLERICQKLDLHPGMRVLDIGCGWGGFARYATEKYNVRVCGMTVSKEQYEWAKKSCAGLPVEILLQDYRQVSGVYDRVLSIGFFEHVGSKNYHTYMELVKRCLDYGGISFLQTIGANSISQRTGSWTDKYIFPNGEIPSLGQLAESIIPHFIIESWDNFGLHYDKTLMAWYDNFNGAWPGLKKNYSDRFYRMWRFYLLSSAGGFRSRFNHLWQIVMMPRR